MSSKYFSALGFDELPDWYNTATFYNTGWHPHVTVHYFGAVDVTTAEHIKQDTQKWSGEVFTLKPVGIRQFGQGLALVFDQDSELARLEVIRDVIGGLPTVAPHIDKTFPIFRAHMSLPVMPLSVALMDSLVLTGPVLIEKRTSLVRA